MSARALSKSLDLMAIVGTAGCSSGGNSDSGKAAAAKPVAVASSGRIVFRRFLNGTHSNSAPFVTLTEGGCIMIRRLAVGVLAAGVIAVLPVSASASVALNGSFFQVIQKPNFTSECPSGVANECGSIQLSGLGAADWAYTFGPTFDPNRRCFDVDGTLVLTLHSDGSTISGPLTGIFCPRPSGTGHQHAGAISYGNPFVEDDNVYFANGTGQFAGLSGDASFHTSAAGARFRGTLTGTLS